MSGKSIIEAINKIIGDKNQPADSVDIENYASRPSAVQTRGVHAPAPNPDGTTGMITSPLTETARVEQEVTITVPLGSDTVTFAVATQITMTDANGNEIVFNYAAP